jgi:hypothetical protein
MAPIQLDPSLLQQLADAQTPVPLCDARGTVVGHYLPEAEYLKVLYANHAIGLSDEEIARRRAETGGSTLEEIWRELDVR